jgi:hypothetical protein
MIDLVGSSCPLAGDLLANPVISSVRGRAFRGISGPLAHPLHEFLGREPMGIHAPGGGPFSLQSALVLSVTALVMTPLPPAGVVLAALGVVIPVVGTGKEVRTVV